MLKRRLLWGGVIGAAVLSMSLGMMTGERARAEVDVPPDVSKAVLDRWARPLFPEASFPYVQTPNGCGADNWTRLVPERPLCIFSRGHCINDFTAACNRHDLCYLQLSQTREACDAAFYRDMLGNCPQNVTAFGQARCRWLARVYYHAVAKNAGLYFLRNRDKQAAYENLLRKRLAQLEQHDRLTRETPGELGQ